MKRTIFISVFALIGTIAYSQSYDDFLLPTKMFQLKQSKNNSLMVAIMVVTIIMVLPNMM